MTRNFARFVTFRVDAAAAFDVAAAVRRRPVVTVFPSIRLRRGGLRASGASPSAGERRDLCESRGNSIARRVNDHSGSRTAHL